jgi:hypothetical protein
LPADLSLVGSFPAVGLAAALVPPLLSFADVGLAVDGERADSFPAGDVPPAALPAGDVPDDGPKAPGEASTGPAALFGGCQPGT